MSANTKIEWADHTFNPWIGCTKVGPGCDHCYAEADFDKRRHVVQWGAGQERKRTTPSTWAQPIKWNAEAARLGIRYRVFCASLADVFDNAVPTEWRGTLWRLINATPHLDWLLLTKRIGNVTTMMYDPEDPQPNVWIGATITSQEEADRDIPKLLAVPAAKRFLSMEPLLGPVDLTDVPMPESGHGLHEFSPIITGNALHRPARYPRLPVIDWVIVGGEIGPHARPMDVSWARSIVQQCKAAGVPVLVKQLGAQPRGWCAAHVHIEPEDREDLECDFYEANECSQPCHGRCAAMVSKKGSDMAEWPEDLRVREIP